MRLAFLHFDNLLNALSKKDTRRLDAIKEKKRALTKKEQQAKQKESKKKKNHKKNQKKKQKKIAEEFYDYYSDDDDYYYEPVLSIWHDGPATLGHQILGNHIYLR